jgi:hypothetical protein
MAAYLNRPRPGRQMVVYTVSGEVPAEMTASADNWRLSWGDSVEG